MLTERDKLLLLHGYRRGWQQAGKNGNTIKPDNIDAWLKAQLSNNPGTHEDYIEFSLWRHEKKQEAEAAKLKAQIASGNPPAPPRPGSREFRELV